MIYQYELRPRVFNPYHSANKKQEVNFIVNADKGKGKERA
jgi:hypothetical protein